MDERSHQLNDQVVAKLIRQLTEKTEEGKISWTTGFEDGQFKTVLPEGALAFVIQVKGDVRKFLVLDEKQEYVMEVTIPKHDTENEPAHHPKWLLYLAIGKLQEMARSQALHVDEKLAQAEKLLSAL